jgi:hypothetical protein
MLNIFHDFKADEAGFIVSSELILVSTITVLALVVGLTEVSFGVNQELEDVGSAFGSVNQGFRYAGVVGFKGRANGSLYNDEYDECDSQWDVTCEVSKPRPESY